MTRAELLRRISIDPQICGGKPCVRGHRIWVSLILDLLADGVSERDILANYPSLTAEDIRACIGYGETEVTSIPDHHRVELAHRLAEADEIPSAGIPWEALRARLLGPR
jgi:uncharacterized protein (DUF433 family)